MTREIKFRVWDFDEKKWKKPRRIVYTPDLKTRKSDAFTLEFFGTYVICQFTGLKDKKGKEIFEGDIFDCIYKEDGCKHKLVVVWDEERASFTIKNYGKCEQPNVHQTIFDIEREEVIGNIWENKELLK